MSIDFLTSKVCQEPIAKIFSEKRCEWSLAVSREHEIQLFISCAYFIIIKIVLGFYPELIL